MSHVFSNENQSATDTAYRFGEFELYPGERLLTRERRPVSLQPKAFDALLCLVRRAERLVSKQELIDTLWPEVHVSDANLTNTIVSLRKIVGYDAIHTVSKHGYRFALPVLGEPGVGRAMYQRFARANQLTAQRSLESMDLARELYWTCLAEDPGFAPAWAWLGRCCWFLAKFRAHASANADLAKSAFRRAFALDPDLACAHQFYTLLQADTGQGDEAIDRLSKRLERHPAEPESFAGLVHVLRFRGLLEESVEAHKQAVDLDPTIVTSVAHTWFLAGEYAAAIETYSGRAAYYLDAAAWAALGDQERAKTLLHERLGRMSLSPLMAALLRSLLALLEGKRDDAVREIESADATHEPEVQVYFARHYARMGLADEAVSSLKTAERAGFVCAPFTLNSDKWLDAARGHPEYGSLLCRTETLAVEGRARLRRLAGQLGRS
jgi:tetratricopeptide (TPR) repeat protein